MGILTGVYTSAVFDDPRNVVKDLLEEVGKHDPESSIGLLFCDSQVDCQAILSELQGKVSFPIIGGTALSFPFATPDGNEYSAGVMILSKPGLKYGFAVSEVLDPAHAKLQMQQVFAKAKEKLGTEPKLVMPFFPLMPGVTTDAFVRELFDVAQDKPVFGGVITNDLISTKAAVFANGQCLEKSMVLLLLGGDIRPVFAVANQVTKMSEYAPVVTKSSASTVFSVDDMPFCDYMKTLGLVPEKRINGVDALMQYGPIPVEMQRKDVPDDEVPEIRCISYTNIENGSVVFSGSVPEGTRVHVGLLYAENVEQSAKNCLENLQKNMDAKSTDGYKYSAMFCVSCVARYFVLTGRENVERILLTDSHKMGIPALGFYSMCEIAPTTPKDAGGKPVNRSHSAAIVMCAI